MSRIRITTGFKYGYDGYNVKMLNPGDIIAVDDQAAKTAMSEGWGEEIADEKPARKRAAKKPAAG